MNMTSIFAPLIHALWYLLPLFIISIVLKTPWFKGVMGEFKVNLLLKLFLSNKHY